MKVVFASRNRHKTEQIALLLPGLDIVALEEVAPGLTLDEPWDTFTDNALAKARAVVQATGLPAIADDSGLEVDALGGAPGVRSARYAGDAATDAANNRKLIKELRDVPTERCTCRYRCAAVFVTSDGREIVATGSCEGHVVLEARGTLGFGYDPHVVPAGQTRTMGEIPTEDKLAFSHRGRAFRALAERMAELSHLDEGEVAGDPIDQFHAWFEDARRAIGVGITAMTLATADTSGRPSARIVLLKNVDDKGFVFYTNYESRKGSDLDANPRAALVVYWDKLGRQVRVEGSARRLADDESDFYFASRPLGSRLSAWASRQSAVVADRGVLEKAAQEAAVAYGQDPPRPGYWGGYAVEPQIIEFWQHREDRLHDRLRYRRDNERWVLERLSP